MVKKTLHELPSQERLKFMHPNQFYDFETVSDSEWLPADDVISVFGQYYAELSPNGRHTHLSADKTSDTTKEARSILYHAIKEGTRGSSTGDDGLNLGRFFHYALVYGEYAEENLNDIGDRALVTAMQGLKQKIQVKRQEYMVSEVDQINYRIFSDPDGLLVRLHHRELDQEGLVGLDSIFLNSTEDCEDEARLGLVVSGKNNSVGKIPSTYFVDGLYAPVN